MSKTYFFLLQWLPQPLARFVLSLWYLLLILAIIILVSYPKGEFIYWDA